MPRYQHASYSGETIAMDNGKMRVEMHKRLSGWGFAEIYGEDGKLMGVLDHFGEIMVRDMEIPMRMESETCTREDGEFGSRAVFAVKAQNIPLALKGSSFDPWMRYPFEQNCLAGTVTLTLAPDKPILYLEYRYEANQNLYATYIKGPWLKVGEASFGADKHDAIFPGVEWNVGREWSSGSDWFKDPWANKCIPHPNKIAIPVMAVSHGRAGIGMGFDLNKRGARWFNYRANIQQPVFASPNFIERMDNHLMGLKLPDVEIEAQENKLFADQPLEIHLGERIAFDAEIFLADGNSMEVVYDYVTRHGMPDPGEPRWPYRDAIERIARAYDSHLFFEGKGFGNKAYPEHISPMVPAFLRRYIFENPSTALGISLADKIKWCDAQPGSKTVSPDRLTDIDSLTRDELIGECEKIIKWQREDGAFCFDPDGRHYMKDDFVVARAFHEPMGQAGDPALDFCATSAIELFRMSDALRALDKGIDVTKYTNAALKGLDFCRDLDRPEGGDYWETPLHAPNLLAAGHAAIAWYLAYRETGDEAYAKKAVYWIRALIPFTHLWTPKDKPMLYNTKPCLCSSDWYFANWVRDHVQWEVLATFLMSAHVGIDWSAVDPDTDWTTYLRGVTQAAMRWMLDHKDQTWLPHNMPWTLDDYNEGAFDDCYPDTHNTTSGNYGGLIIMPDVIADLLYIIIDVIEKKPA